MLYTPREPIFSMHSFCSAREAVHPARRAFLFHRTNFLWNKKWDCLYSPIIRGLSSLGKFHFDGHFIGLMSVVEKHDDCSAQKHKEEAAIPVPTQAMSHPATSRGIAGPAMPMITCPVLVRARPKIMVVHLLNFFVIKGIKTTPNTWIRERPLITGTKSFRSRLY